MGNTCPNVNEKEDKVSKDKYKCCYHLIISKNDFVIECSPIGKGGFGNIYKVKHKKTNNIYAMKEMNKVSIIKRKCISNIINELKALQCIRNELFIINIQYAFHSIDSLYIVTDYLSGGNLRSCIHKHNNTNNKFKESEIKFIIANIVLCLRTLRLKGIVHRDLKPDNLLFDSNGYLHLADFGIARIVPYIYDKDTSGTPGYMAPETYLNNHKYSKYYQVDYFALGVICYEMVFGKRFYHNRNHQEIKEVLLNKNIRVDVKDLPRNGKYADPKGMCDFMNRLLKRKYNERLGFGDINEIINHSWLSDVDWEKMMNMQVKSPFAVDTVSEGNDYYVKHHRKKSECDYNEMEYKTLVRKINKLKVFDNYYYNGDMYLSCKKDNDVNAVVNDECNCICDDNNVNDKSIGILDNKTNRTDRSVSSSKKSTNYL